MPQHILDQYPISSCRILDKYVGDGPDDLSVLYYGGTAGSLDNAAGDDLTAPDLLILITRLLFFLFPVISIRCISTE